MPTPPLQYITSVTPAESNRTMLCTNKHDNTVLTFMMLVNPKEANGFNEKTINNQRYLFLSFMSSLSSLLTNDNSI